MPVLALLAVACGPATAPDPPAARATPTPVARPQAVPTVAASPTPAVSPATVLSVATTAGLWRVAAADGTPPRGAGSLLEIAPEQMAWSYRTADGFNGSDLCDRPYVGPLSAATADAMLRPRFARALARLRPHMALGPVPYEIECTGGGRWGPGQIGTAHLYALDRDHLLMSWYDDSVLLLARQRVAAPAGKDAASVRADDYTP
jgi:hypothetical protein